MATLGHWTRTAALTVGNPPESWTTPTADFFNTEARNDGSAYAQSINCRFTLPSSDLADGYLLVAAYEFEDDSNGRCNPQGQWIQQSGTGNFVGGPTGGYTRDNSEDRAYVRCWGFVDNPSASATFDFQWKADSDDTAAGAQIERAEVWIIPLYYQDAAWYTSTSSSLYGGTTPNVVTGFSGTDGTDISISSNVVTCSADNAKYLVLGSQFFEGRGGRTQRWHGFDIDGAQEDGAKAYSYYRNTSNDESGDLFCWAFETVTANVTIEQTCYRGDGVSNGQGGADSDGSTPSVGDHAIVVLQLNDNAEWALSKNNANSGDLTGGPTDLSLVPTAGVQFNDSASFTRASDTAWNCEQDMDVLFFANISCASNNVANTGRHTLYAELTDNGTEVTTSFAGDYLRNNQGSIDTFGWSANLLGVHAVSTGDDLGVSTTTLSGSEAQGDPIMPNGWGAFGLINLDTLAASAGATITMSGTVQADAAWITGNVEIDTIIYVSGTVQADSADVLGDRVVNAQDAGITGNITVSGGVTVTLSGTVQAQASTITGDVERAVTLSATLVAQDADISGALERVVTISGTVIAQSAIISGAVERVVTMSGTLVSGPPTMSGLVSNAVVVGGTIAAQAAGITGQVERVVTSSGVVVSGGAGITGDVERAITSSGTLPASDANITGNVNVAGNISLDGTVTAQASGISGAVERAITISGSPQAQNADVIGDVAIVESLSGTISARASGITGAVDRVVVLSGTVQADNAELFADRIVNAQDAGITGDLTVVSSGADVTLSGTVQAQEAAITGNIERAVTINGTVASNPAEITGNTILPAQNATISGNITVNTGTGTITLSGSIQADNAELFADRIVNAQDAGITGDLTVVSSGADVTLSGTVQAQEAAITGNIERAVTINGTVASNPAEITGDVERAVTLSGTITSLAGDISGSINIGSNIDLSGVLGSQDSGITGTVARVVALSGNVDSQDSDIAGSVSNALTLQGTIASQDAGITGTAIRKITISGTFQTDNAGVSGAVEREITLSGTVTSQAPGITGSIVSFSILVSGYIFKVLRDPRTETVERLTFKVLAESKTERVRPDDRRVKISADRRTYEVQR